MTHETYSFGDWLAQRRKSLDLTQRELAAQTHCALATIKKIEMDERRPSRDLAEALAPILQIPVEAQPKFIECARGLRPVDALAAVGTSGLDDGQDTALRFHDLPVSTTPLVGRETECAQVAGLLGQPECRLLTLMGSGGAGKTRLALEAARRLRERFSDGAVFVPLAAVTDAALIPNHIAYSLNLSLTASADQQLVAYLRDKSLLLVLDNCEQIAEGVGWLSELLIRAPGVKLLTTSRERLQLTEEWVYEVPMLDESQAVTLFAQTARRLNPRFEPAEQSTAIALICRLVENLPLALELAASWTPYLSCEQIAQNIQRDIDFLTANVRNIPERHRSIRAVFDYSWQLLSAAEQNVMMRLSVFRGGWTIDEAEPIAGASLPIMRGLVEKSLARVVEQGRYDLHELIRQYAADRLRAADQEDAVKQRHSAVYLALAGELDSALQVAGGITAFSRLDQEQDNLRAGIRWALDATEITYARQYVDRLFIYWQRRGHLLEGEYWTKAVDARPGEEDSPLLCWILLHASVFLAIQGRLAEASPYKTRAEAMARRLEDPETMLRFLFIEAQATPNTEAAVNMWDEFFALGAVTPIHSKGAPMEALIASGHCLYGDTLRDAGRLVEAAVHYRQSLELYRRIGNVDLIAYPTGNLGRLALLDGRTEEAYQCFSESVALSRAIGSRVGIADWLQQLGNAALVMGNLPQAESCCEEALALYQEMGNAPAYADVLAVLGYVALIKEEARLSNQRCQESLNIFRSLSDMMSRLGADWGILGRSELPLCLRTAALLDVAEHQIEQALTRLAIAESIQQKGGQTGDQRIQTRVDEALRLIQTDLPAETFSRLWERAFALSPNDIWTQVV